MTAIRGPILLSMGLHGLFAVVLAVAPLGAKAVLEPRQEITIDLIEPAATQPAHYQVGEDQMDGRGMLAQQVQCLDPVGGREHRISGMLERVDCGAAQLRLVFRLLVLVDIRLWFLLPDRWRRESNRCQVLSRCRVPLILSARWRSCQMAKA